MKKSSALLGLAALLLVGAGCSGTSTPAAPAAQPYAPQAAAPAPASAPTPEPAQAMNMNEAMPGPAPTAAAPNQPAPAPAPAPAPTTPPSSSQAVSISGFAFQPATITVKAGTTIVWTNQDAVAHTVTADDASFDSGTMPHGATWSHVFSTPGTYTYHCAIHRSMTATVIVQ